MGISFISESGGFFNADDCREALEYWFISINGDGVFSFDKDDGVFLCQIIGAAERIYNKTPDIDNTTAKYTQFMTMLHFLQDNGAIKEMQIGV